MTQTVSLDLPHDYWKAPASDERHDFGIGARAKVLRQKLKLSLQEVADRCGRTKSWLWEIEQGKARNPTIASAVSLSRALGVSLDYLTGLSTTMPDLHPEALRIACELDALLRGIPSSPAAERGATR